MPSLFVVVVVVVVAVVVALVVVVPKRNLGRGNEIGERVPIENPPSINAITFSFFLLVNDRVRQRNIHKKKRNKIQFQFRFQFPQCPSGFGAIFSMFQKKKKKLTKKRIEDSLSNRVQDNNHRAIFKNAAVDLRTGTLYRFFIDRFSIFWFDQVFLFGGESSSMQFAPADN